MMPTLTEALDRAREAAFMVTVLEHQRNAAANQAAHFQAKANMLDEDNRTLRQGIEDLKKQVELQLSREQRQMPVMFIDTDVKSIHDYTHESFKLMGYDPHPAIRAPVAV